MAILLIAGCGAVPQQQLTLPAPLQGEMVEEGHLCDPLALTQALGRKYPGLDLATTQQEIDHLLYVFWCGPPAPVPPSFADTGFGAPFARIAVCIRIAHGGRRNTTAKGRRNVQRSRANQRHYSHRLRSGHWLRRCFAPRRCRIHFITDRNATIKRLYQLSPVHPRRRPRVAERSVQHQGVTSRPLHSS